ncbi:cation transport ATPase [Streptomyces phaeogriseichromatogenes]|nr:cation transport ATPase [Streptomyces murinus]
MTCAACVRRVEKKLGKLAGVTASVNLATGLARVSHPAGVAPESLVAAVEQAGYQAALPVREDDERSAADGEAAESRRERERLTVTALLAVPVLVLSMVPALQFRDWQWLCFVLAAPIAVWSAWPFPGPSASDGGAHLYLEAAVSVPLFVLTGRFLEGHPTPFG